MAVGALAHGRADEVRRVGTEVVVGLRLQVGRGAAVGFDDQRRVVHALLDDRPERVVGLAADDEDLRAVLRHGAAGGHGERRRRHEGCGDAFHVGHGFLHPVSLSGEIPFGELICSIVGEMIICKIAVIASFVS